MRGLLFLCASLLALSACQTEYSCGEYPIRSGPHAVDCLSFETPHGSPTRHILYAIVDREAETVVVEYERESDGARVRETWRIVGEG